MLLDYKVDRALGKVFTSIYDQPFTIILNFFFRLFDFVL